MPICELFGGKYLCERSGGYPISILWNADCSIVGSYTSVAGHLVGCAVSANRIIEGGTIEPVQSLEDRVIMHSYSCSDLMRRMLVERGDMTLPKARVAPCVTLLSRNNV